MRIENCLIVFLLGLGVATLAACGGEQTSSTPAAIESSDGVGASSLRQAAYIKASNTGAGDQFGIGGAISGDAVSLSDDGSTLAVGAPFEASAASGTDGDQSDDSLYGAGAVYVFARNGDSWDQQAYVKASNPGQGDNFGFATALSADGGTMAVSANFEASNATGVNGDQDDDSILQAGAVYLFVRNIDSGWSQQAYLKASNTGEAGTEDEPWSDGDQFGFSVALSDDGNTLAVGAMAEDSAAPGVNGDESDNSLQSAGAVYLFTRSGTAWAQTAYIKPSNPGQRDLFGYSVSLNADGDMLAVGSFDSGGSGVAFSDGLGAVYVFSPGAGGTWSQVAHLEAHNAELGDAFGVSVALSDDGSTLVTSALQEDGPTTGVNSVPVPDDQSQTSTGAAYVFVRDSDMNWSQEAYIKASNTGSDDWFGSRLALSGDGNTLALGTQLEDSSAQGINGSQDDDTALQAGVVYFFIRSGTTWTQRAYVKGANTEASDEFGSSVALNRDGTIMAVGARGEASSATGINGDQSDNSALQAGAVYTFSY